MKPLSSICVPVPSGVELSQRLTAHELARRSDVGWKGKVAMWKHLNGGKYAPLFPFSVPSTMQRLIDLSTRRQIGFVARNELHCGEIKHFKVFNNGAVGLISVKILE